MIQLVKIYDNFSEQYDAYYQNTIVGYLRLCNGIFSVDCPDAYGQQVYSVRPAGLDRFKDQERDYYLRFAVDAIERWMFDTTIEIPYPPAPDVKYEIVERYKE